MKTLSHVLLAIALLSPSVEAVSHLQSESPKLDEWDLSDASITLTHLGCGGGCPAFSIEIRGDGTVIYNGVEGVKVTGKREHKITKGKVSEVVREFYRVNYFSLKDQYVEPQGNFCIYVKSFGTATSISIGGKKKTIYERFGAPQALKDLEGKIYVISDVHQFVSRT